MARRICGTRWLIPRVRGREIKHLDSCGMAGHSKWAGIKHKKAIVDARRGKLFTKLARAITVAAKEGGGDIEGNPALALAVQKAKDASMPKDNIERAIAKGTGEGADADALEAVMYEGYGPGGVAIMVEVLTEPGTLAAVRAALDESGVEVENAEVAQRPKTLVPLDEDGATKLMKLIDALEE